MLTWLTGFAPSLMAASATGAMVALVSVRLLLGATQCADLSGDRGHGRGLVPARPLGAAERGDAARGFRIGQAALGPVVTALILAFGWRQACYVARAARRVVVGAWWYWYARDLPVQHRGDHARGNRASSTATALQGGRRRAPGRWREALLERDVLVLAASYFCMNYVFFMFS